MTSSLQPQFDQLDQLKAQLDAQRPLPAAVVRNLRENLLVNWTFHSNAIEGNTLTLQETRVALEGITVGGKTLREHFEAINHRDAIYQALNKAHCTGDYQDFIELVADCVEQSFEPYWFALGLSAS